MVGVVGVEIEMEVEGVGEKGKVEVEFSELRFEVEFGSLVRVFNFIFRLSSATGVTGGVCCCLARFRKVVPLTDDETESPWWGVSGSSSSLTSTLMTSSFLGFFRGRPRGFF